MPLQGTMLLVCKLRYQTVVSQAICGILHVNTSTQCIHVHMVCAINICKIHMSHKTNPTVP